VLPDHYNNKTELIFPGPDTQSIVPEVHRSDITWAGEEAHLIIIRDLTRPKRNAAQLAESELIPHSHFENAPVALWEEDFSEVKKLIDILSASGISDFRTYFVTHPDEASLTPSFEHIFTSPRTSDGVAVRGPEQVCEEGMVAK
jgi:hypothetical protein